MLPTPFDMMQALVASPSVSSVNPRFDQNNRGVIDLLAEWTSALGFKVEILPLSTHPGKANLVATWGSGADGLVLAGHTDTVPYDEGRWRYDPFTLTRHDERLYGLGICDMKAFFALALEAARAFKAQDLRRPLILVATADEESSMQGALDLVRAGRPQARYALIGEPTGLRPVRMHKGVMMEAVQVRGRSGHSSNPALGVSALEGMYRVMGAILSWREELQRQHRNTEFDVPVPTLNLGHIHGGDNPNRICAHCELHIDVRPLPGMDPEELRSQLRARLEHELAGSGLKVELASLFCGTPPMETPADSLWVRTVEALTGHSASAVAFGTEGPYYRALGMDAVVCGPGDIAQAHQPDEYLACSHIQPTIDLLRNLITTACVREFTSATSE